MRAPAVLATSGVNLQHYRELAGRGSITMAEDFDPYYKWLGIPPHEQPPNHYRLLGIELFEANLDVVTTASDRQMAYLRSFQSGPQMNACQRLLNEVAAARLVLLDVQQKAAYDQSLQASLTASNGSRETEDVPLTPADIYLPTDGIASHQQASGSNATAQPQFFYSKTTFVQATRRRRTQPIVTTFAWILASIACIYALYLVLQAVVANLAPLAI